MTPDDLNDEATFSLVHYLEDLGLLSDGDKETLIWSDASVEMCWDDQKKIMQDGMLQMSQTEAGFALSFFIGFEKVNLPTLESLIEPEKLNGGKKGTPKPELASDLSNFQIVKKVGRQLKPFLEAEKTIVARLLGKNTTKADARLLFQYMFGKMNSKAKPRKWEQLSRKRHK
ncbi:MAG: hypothetical protein H8E32_16615 [Nitrospinae bacterium]|nr:hypothetical protein [Nitrospinota bacterium]